MNPWWVAALICVAAGFAASSVLAAPVTVDPLPGSPYAFGSNTAGPPGSILVAPLNADPRLDVVTEGGVPAAIRRLLAPADPLASPFGVTVVSATNFPQVRVADIDADGDRDILRFQISGNSNEVVAFLNDGAGTFTAAAPGQVDGGRVAVGQFTADNLPDVITAGSTMQPGQLLRPGLGNGQFGAATVLSTDAESGPSLMTAGDTDGDGDQDLIGVREVSGSGRLRVLRNDGAGAFTARPFVALPGVPVAVAAGDVDGDGSADPAVLNDAGNVSVVRATGTPQTTATGLSPANSGGLALADLDGDAKLDIVAVNISTITTEAARPHVVTGNGDGTFAAPQTVGPSLNQPTAVATGDLTGDGQPDLAIVSGFGTRVDLLRNTTSLPQPSATTTGFNNVTTTSANVTGVAGANGGANPTVAVEYGITNGLGSSTTPQTLAADGPVGVVVTGLQPGTTYFARIKVTTASGSATGAIISFTTKGPPTASTTGFNNVTSTSANVVGLADAKGGANATVAIEYGTSNALGSTTAPQALTANGPVGIVVTGLQPATTYFARVRATTDDGTAAGAIVSFTTKAPPPTVTTVGFNNVTQTSANTLGSANPQGGTNPTYSVEYGTTESLGSSTAPQTLASSANGQFVNTVLTGLQPATKYFFRSRITTEEGTATGATLSFTTPDDPAVTLAVPFRGVLLSEAPFTLGVFGDARKVEWDFGERPATEAELANPTAGFQPSGVVGAFAVHKYAAVYGSLSGFPSATNDFLDRGEVTGVEEGADRTVPSTAPAGQSERRRTYLVRARVTLPSGRTRVLASTVVVRPDTAPKPILDATGTEYTEPVQLSSRSFDPDEFVDPDLDVGGRDAIIRERWSWGDGSIDLVREPPIPAPVTHNFFDGTRGAKAPMTDFNPGPLEPVARAEAVRKYADELKNLRVTGPRATNGARQVTLTVTDRSGRKRSRTFSVPLRARQVPKPALEITGATPVASKNANSDVEIRQPIIVDKTPIEFDLRRSAADPKGKIAFHILEVGYPVPKPCPAISDPGQCERGKSEIKPANAFHAPIVVSDDELDAMKGKVSMIFHEATKEGEPLSVLDTAYDETGAVGTTRYDGFVVEEAGGTCKTVRGKKVGKTDLVFSGTCVNLNKDNNVFWTKEAITLNGLRVRPSPGHFVVVRRCGGGADKIRSVAVEPLAQNGCGENVSPGKGSLEVLAGADPIVKLDVAAQQKLAGENPSFDAVPTAGATYQGFTLKDTADLRLANSTGRLAFAVNLPGLLAPPGGQNSGDTVVEAADVPQAVVIRPFNGIGVKTSRARPRARAAAVPQPVIDAAATTIGGINIPGLKFTYDPPTDTFVGSADVAAGSFPLPLPVDGLRLRVVLRNGEFVEASGDVDGIVPLVGAINLTGFGFTITPQGGGVILQGRVRFADTSGLVLDGSGAVTSNLSSNFSVRIDGNATVVQLLPVTASVTFGGAGVGFGAGTGAQFGPARFNLNMEGAFQGKTFQIAGSGNACLFLCLGVRGLASERAVAGCGSIDLVLTTISAGFGVIFNPTDVNIFASCDLSPYGSRPARRVTGTASDFTVPTRVLSESLAVTVPAAGLQIGSTAPKPTFGQTPQVKLVAPNGATVAQTSSELGATSTNGNTGDPNNHVFVEQDAEAGVTRFLVPKPATEGSYAVVPLPGSIAIAQPQYAYGDPALSKVITSKKLEDAREQEIAQVKDGDLLVAGGSPSDSTLDKILKSEVKFRAAATASATKAKPFPTSFKPASSLVDTLKIDPAAVQFDPKSGIGSTFAKAAPPKTQQTYAEATIDPDLLTVEDLDDLVKFSYAGNLPPGQRMTFYETGPLTNRTLFSVKAPQSGKLFGSDLFVPTRNNDKYIIENGKVTGPSKRHCIDAFVTNEVGVPRGKVRITCFDYEPIPVEVPDTEFQVDIPGSAGDLLKKVREIEIDPRGVDILGSNGFAMIEVTKGDFSFSQQISTDWIAGQQATQKLGFRAGASAGPPAKKLGSLIQKISRSPVRKRSFAFRVGGLPRGPGKITVKVAGLPVPGQPGKVDTATGTLRPGHRHLSLKLGSG